MKNIVFSGGGTLGSVTPLLGLREHLSSEKYNFTWIGTRFGPEKNVISNEDISFESIYSGKIRRYFSIKNITDVFKLIIGIFQSISILKQKQADLCITTGGFVSVPVHIAAWLLGIPTWVHQQDIKPGLANKFMAKLADKISVSLEDSKNNFSKEVEWIGNFVRSEIKKGSKQQALNFFDLEDEPTLLALGGGTGARTINNLINDTISKLINSFQIIHLTGEKRKKDYLQDLQTEYENYRMYEFLSEEIKHAYTISNLVICRAGFATLTELSALEKPALLIPKPGHQEKNAELISTLKGVRMLAEPVNREEFIKYIEKINSKNIKPSYKKLLPNVKKKTTERIVSNLFT